MKFSQLITTVQQTNNALQQQAVKAVNHALTIRNWLIGFYIVEFEQNGEDRAVYGDNLLAALSKALAIKGLSETNLRLNRQFYNIYPQIRQTLSDEFENNKIYQTLSDELIAKDEKQALPMHPDLTVPPEKIISRLSFSHITELIQINDPLKRAFYEIESIKGTWSVRELKRQINSLYYERSAISKDPALLSKMVLEGTESFAPEHIVKDIYTFEFLGLPVHLAVEEQHLETALLTHLQEFIIELGRGFCFEARQQRILIGDEYFFIDLVFYHRILKCHVLIEGGSLQPCQRRATEHVPELLQSRSDATRRQPARRHFTGDPQKRCAGAIRHCRYGPATVCKKIPTDAARQRTTRKLY